jgi:excisionase family DNA binding protein
MLCEEAADFLGISPWTLRGKAREKKISFYRPFGARGRLIFKRDDLQAFLDSKRVPAVPASSAR